MFDMLKKMISLLGLLLQDLLIEMTLIDYLNFIKILILIKKLDSY